MTIELKQAQAERLVLDADGNIPNNSDLPVIVYWEVLDQDEKNPGDSLEERFRGNGWTGCWRWGVYDFHHYHSNTHEVLGVAQGCATLSLGAPGREHVSVALGDVIVLPAGTGHCCRLASDDFEVVGAYPKGPLNYDLIKDDQEPDDAKLANIREAPLPAKDPVFGEDGELMQAWGIFKSFPKNSKIKCIQS